MQYIIQPGRLSAIAAMAATALILLSASAAEAQQYDYRSGGARVIQNSGGLATPSNTYITRGTLSPSAQVPILGSQGYVNSSLPSGAIKYPGRDAQGNPIQQSSGPSGLPAARMGATVGQPGDYMRSDLNPNFSYTQRQGTQARYITMPARGRNQKTKIYSYQGDRPASSGRANTVSGASTYGTTTNSPASGYRGY